MSGRRSRRGTCGWIESFSGRADACWVFLSINIVNFFSHALIETKSLPSSSLLPDPDLPFETIDFLIEEQGRSEDTTKDGWPRKTKRRLPSSRGGKPSVQSHVGLDLVETGEPAETVVRLPEVVEQKIPAYLELIGEELVVATLVRRIPRRKRRAHRS
ncbi:hypothetical protein Tco_0233320 [Tanacetum coccineum]